MKLIRISDIGYPMWVDEVLDRMINTVFNDNNENENSFTPAVNVVENHNEYRLEFIVPGYNKEDIKINIENNELVVTGEPKLNGKEENVIYENYEYVPEPFEERWTLPENTIDINGIKADYENGILKITFPKLEHAKVKQIEIA